MAGLSPTQRSLRHLRQQGLQAQVVEHWVPRVNIRRDLFGVIDIVAMSSERVVGVQTTSASNMAARMRKSEASALLEMWLRTGCGFEVHGWGLKGARGKRKLWQCRVARAVPVMGGVEWWVDRDEEETGWRTAMGDDA
jgi:hypothetical protein